MKTRRFILVAAAFIGLGVIVSVSILDIGSKFDSSAQENTQVLSPPKAEASEVTNDASVGATDSTLETEVASVHSSLELYQQYYVLQQQRDNAGAVYDSRRRVAWLEGTSVKGKLSSDSSNIDLHRRLIRAQNEWKQAQEDWFVAIRPIDEQLDIIREELKSRGEPAPQ